MKTAIEKLEIEGVTYVPESSITSLAENVDGMRLVMIRTYSAGVHYGYLKKRESTLAGIEVTLVNARRAWSWTGAASLSQLATEGTSSPDSCKFPCEVQSIELIAIEVISMTSQAKTSLDKVKVWVA